MSHLFADPVRKKFPVATPSQVKSSVRLLMKSEAAYDGKTLLGLWGRIVDAAKVHGVELPASVFAKAQQSSGASATGWANLRSEVMSDDGEAEMEVIFGKDSGGDAAAPRGMPEPPPSSPTREDLSPTGNAGAPFATRLGLEGEDEPDEVEIADSIFRPMSQNPIVMADRGGPSQVEAELDRDTSPGVGAEGGGLVMDPIHDLVFSTSGVMGAGEGYRKAVEAGDVSFALLDRLRRAGRSSVTNIPRNLEGDLVLKGGFLPF